MSRSKRSRAKQRKLAAAQPAQPAARAADDASRLAPARRRARAAKIGMGTAAAISVGASMGLARETYAGHSKHPVKPLAIPQPLYVVVRQNLLQAGIVAPATAPPDAATSTS